MVNTEIARWTGVSTAAELVEATQAKVLTIEVNGVLRGMPMPEMRCGPVTSTSMG